jgi:hypothetical protein
VMDGTDEDRRVQLQVADGWWTGPERRPALEKMEAQQRLNRGQICSDSPVGHALR